MPAEPVRWAGAAPNGAPLPAGLYGLTVESRAEGKVIRAAPAEHFAKVAEARIENGEIQLVFAGGVTVPASAITAIREPA